MDTKSIFQSKVFWFNAITIVLAMIVELTPLLKEDNAITVLKVLGYITAIGNVLLRFMTVVPVTLTGAPKRFVLLLALGLSLLVCQSASADHCPRCRGPVLGLGKALVVRAHNRPLVKAAAHRLRERPVLRAGRRLVFMGLFRLGQRLHRRPAIRWVTGNQL